MSSLTIYLDEYGATGDNLLDPEQPWKYFKTFKSLLENRSTYKLRMKNAPFYSVYNVGDYTFSPYKVIWAEQSGSFSAAVATSEIVPLQGERVFVPDPKIFFVDFHQKEPAYFLCGLLNSDLVRDVRP